MYDTLKIMGGGEYIMGSDLSGFVDLAKELGAVDAKIIDPVTIKTAAWVRMKCSFGCKYGPRRRHCCPPNTPTHKETQEMIDCYKHALLVHCKGNWNDPSEVVLKLEREIFLAGYYKVIGFGAGPCMVCKTCHPEKCAQPKNARPSMEACGIDVFETVRANGWPIMVLKDLQSDGNYYGLLLID
jgi:predicted metal-binding protein